MRKACKLTLFVAATAFAAMPMLPQTSPARKLSFDVISIKPAAPLTERIIGGGPRGDRYTMKAATLPKLLQSAYQRPSATPVAPLKVIGGPGWIDNDRYDIQATADCGGGALSREQVQLMIQSMLEDRFQLKAHMDTREGEVYNLVVAKNPPKIKLSEDQTPIVRRAGTPMLPCNPVPEPPANPGPPLAGPAQRGNPFDPDNFAPRGFMGMSFSQAGITLRGSAASISSMLGMLRTMPEVRSQNGLERAVRLCNTVQPGRPCRPGWGADGSPQRRFLPREHRRARPQLPTPFHPFSMPYRNSA